MEETLTVVRHGRGLILRVAEHHYRLPADIRAKLTLALAPGETSLPSFGTTGKKKRVKYGADIVAADDLLYALKGNKTLEFWRFVPLSGPALAAAPARSGVMTGSAFGIRQSSFAIAPNPLAGGFATLRYTLPKPGPVTIAIFDIAGRTAVPTRRLAANGRQSAVSLDLRNLSAGVYLVRLTTDNFSATSKLVVQH